MSNHLRELIDRMGQDKVFIQDDLEMSVEEDRAVFNFLAHNAEKSVCFYGGPIEVNSNLKAYPELAKLPYDNCWIEFDGYEAGAPIGFLCVAENDSGYIGQVYAKNKKQDCWIYWFTYKSLNGKSLVNKHMASHEETFYQMLIHAPSAFLSALNCSNINKIEHIHSDKLQKARAKRGKKPLFSYWTLEIDMERSAVVGIDNGGTHSSPRLHLRRGHPRQYAPGKWCWVQPCAVGNKNLGMVHKDYAVSRAHA